MAEAGAPRHDPIPIGEVAKPPFARLPEPKALFARRAERFRFLAGSHDLKPYLLFLANICAIQHGIQEGLPVALPPAADAIARARNAGMPPLDRGRFASDAAFDTTLARLLAAAGTVEMPEPAKAALLNLMNADAAARGFMVRCVLDDAVPVEAMAEHLFVAAALQVHFARLAAQLDAAGLVPVGNGACPACGAPLVSSLVVGWQGAHGTRFCACALCGTMWNYVRVKCTLCGSTKGISYQEVEGGAGTVKAETCDSCRSYVKILHQHKDPALDPVADDVASLGLDLLVRETGLRRGGMNPFLLGY
jgi:FdhE protein